MHTYFDICLPEQLVEAFLADILFGKLYQLIKLYNDKDSM